MFRVTTSIEDELEIVENIFLDEPQMSNQKEVILGLLRRNNYPGGLTYNCRIEVEKDGEYYDSDEYTVTVNDDCTEVLEWV